MPFIHQGRMIHVDDSQHYANGRRALVLFSRTARGNRTEAVLTVNIPDAELEPGEFCVKTWAENTDIARDALASGIFEDTGKRVITGFVEAEIWRFRQ